MKKTLITLAVVALAVAAYAQGKVQLANGVQPIFLTSDTTKLLPADVSKAGGALPFGDTSDPLPSGKLIMFGLYGGSASTSLSFLTAVPVNDGNELDNGKINPVGFALPAGFPALDGSNNQLTYFFQVKLWDSPYATFEAQTAAGTKDYSGVSSIFTVAPGNSAFVSISQGPSTTWAPGNLVIGVVPEPSTFALAGLGAAALLIFRRRK